MKINKNKLLFNSSFIFLWLMIASIPLSLLFKLKIFGLEFSISYIFFMIFLVASIAFFIFFIKKYSNFFNQKVILLMIVSFLIFVTNSFYRGIEIKFFIFLFSFILSIFIGYLYNDLIIKYFKDKFIIIIYLLSILGLILYYYNIPLFDFKTTGSNLYFINSFGHYRLSSILLNPNSFAYLILLYFSFFLYSKKSLTNNIWGLIILLTFFLTGSRSAFAGLVLALIVYGFKYFKQKYFLYKAAIISLIFIFIFLLLFATNTILINYDIRFEKFSIALQYIFTSLKYFLLGVPSELKIEKNGISFSDNMYLYLFLKMGFLSTIFFIYAYLHIIFRSSKILFSSKCIDVKPYALFIVSTFIPMFFSNLLLFTPVYILIGLSIGIIQKGGIYNEKSISS